MPSDSRVAIVTGASRGIGEHIAIELARRGFRLALVHSSAGSAAATDCVRAKLADAGEGTATTVRQKCFQCDITDPSACEELVQSVVAWAGRLDVLVNNAGVSVDADDWLEESFERWQEAWRQTMAVNYYAPCNLSYLAVQQYRKQEQSRTPPGCDEGTAPLEAGRIVNVSSRGAYCGDPTAPAYAASKCALNVFHNATAKQVAKEGIFVFTVAPGATLTDMWTSIASPEQLQGMADAHPLKRLNQTSEIAAIVGYLACDAPPTMTGNIVDANGAIYMR